MRIMIIEEDIVLQKMLATNLKEYGFISDVVETLKDGEYYLDIRNYDLVLMASKLPDGDSIDIISDIKFNYPDMTVIVLSDNNNTQEEIESFNAGANDYIKKPFDFNVLLVRIKCRLNMIENKIIEIELLTIDPDEEKIIYDGKQIDLAGKPFEVLTYFAQHRDQILSKEQVLEAIWFEPELVSPNVIDVAIDMIRQKIDKRFDITTIETVTRRGYRFCFPNIL